MYYWDSSTSLNTSLNLFVSVVVRRKYYWDLIAIGKKLKAGGFSSCQKNVLLGRNDRRKSQLEAIVSVVVRRMYYWDERSSPITEPKCLVSVVVRRMYYWDISCARQWLPMRKFQQLLEECTIGTFCGVFFLDKSKFQQLLEECTIGTHRRHA